jgi:putative transposase
MQLVERHIISKNNKNWKSIDYFSFISKNLYNQALYYIKQEYLKTGKYLRFYNVEKHLRLEDCENYKILPNNTSQQILMVLDKNIKSFFQLLKKYKKDKKSLNGIPKFPKYKDKEKGRNILVFTKNQFSLKNEFIYFPKKINLNPIKTKVDNIQQIRIITKSSCYVLEVVYNFKEVNKKQNSNYLSIDLGINNLCAITTNQPGLKPILINGKQIKSFNAYFNKLLASEKSQLKKNHNKEMSNKIRRMYLCRENWINNFMHHISKMIVSYCIKNNINNIIIGKNKEWKQNINIGKANNQKFVMIPYDKLIQQMKYKSEKVGLNFILQEECYTSKCDSLALESVEKHEEYLGKRIKRGLFQSSVGKLINADINGSLNILRKVIGDNFVKNLSDIGSGYDPVKVNFNKYKNLVLIQENM